jgi:hypothetical protein
MTRLLVGVAFCVSFGFFCVGVGRAVGVPVHTEGWAVPDQLDLFFFGYVFGVTRLWRCDAATRRS